MSKKERQGEGEEEGCSVLDESFLFEFTDQLVNARHTTAALTFGRLFVRQVLLVRFDIHAQVIRRHLGHGLLLRFLEDETIERM